MPRALLLVVACVAPIGLTASAAPDPRPNILLIISEDNGLQFGCYGDRTVPTPHVDALAAGGVRFTNAYVTQAVCSPSRASIYTGLYPHQNGQIGLATHKFTTVGDPPNLPRLMQAAGYRTGLIGKLHVLPEDAYPYDFRFNDTKINGFSHRDVKRTAEVAGAFIAESTEPFCLTVCFADAHLPFIPQDCGLPKKPLTTNSPLLHMWPDVGVGTPRLLGHLANYYNCMSRLDTGIGCLVSELERTGRAANTIVIYLSDHGPQFARGKGASYELSLRVPLVIRDPRSSGTAAVRDELVSTVDLLPTILDAAGIEAPAKLPGRSLMPLLQGPATEWRRYLFTEWNTSHVGRGPVLFFPQRTVRDERYKLILNVASGTPNPVEAYYTTARRVDTGPTQEEIDAAPDAVRAMYRTWRAAPPIELYDLEQDPQEGVNLAERADVAPVRERLLAELHAWREATADPLRDPEKRRLLADEHREQHERTSRDGRKAHQSWRYPQYLYE